MPVYKNEKTKTKDGRKWFYKCQYIDTSGKKKSRVSKMFATKEEATKEEAKFLLNTNNVTESKKTIYDLYNSYFFLDNNVINKESSIYTKEHRIRKYVLPFFYDEKTNKYKSITKLNIENLKDWKLWLNSKDLSLVTKKSIYNSFSSLILYGIEKFQIEYNPLKIIGNFKERNDKVIEKEKVRFLTTNEYKLFISEVDEEFKTIFHFLYEIGCRKGELQALTWEDINFKNGKIRINKTLSTKNINGGIKITNTKNKKIRYVDSSKNLLNELKCLYDIMKKLDGFKKSWFVFGGIKYISSTTLARKKDDAFKTLEDKDIHITKITIHEFRHSSASFMISNDIPIEIIAYRLGDSPETIRKVYAHLFPDTQKNATNLFESL